MSHKRQPLVCQYLEHASVRVLEKYGSLLREEVGRSHGVYSLYKRDRLYYVGLATNLRGRLKQHLRDHHKGLWDNFSVYLTLDSGFMKELESLVMRIANPKGNRQRGKFARSQNLLTTLKRRIADEQANDLEELFGGHLKSPKRYGRKKKGRGGRRSERSAALARWIQGPMQLRRTSKGKTYFARVRRDGTIRVRGISKKVFNSPSMAAMACLGRRVNGWTFWRFQQGPGKWVPLNALRRK